jgi:poly(A) polymerase Pap1
MRPCTNLIQTILQFVKQNIDKLLVARFIQFVEEATWLSPIVVVPKKNGKLKICIKFEKLNAATKKDPHQYGK